MKSNLLSNCSSVIVSRKAICLTWRCGLSFMLMLPSCNLMADPGDVLLKIVNPSMKEDSRSFGREITALGPELFIATTWDSTQGADGEGFVQRFDCRTGELINTFHNPPRRDDIDLFGYSLSVGAGLLGVGAPGDFPQGHHFFSAYGSAFVFDQKSGDLLTAIQKENPSKGDRLGNSIAMVGDRIFVGVPGAESSTGEVLFFDVKSGDQLGVIPNPDPQPGDRFGSKIAEGGGKIIITAPGENGGRGHAFIADVDSVDSIHEIPNPDPHPNPSDAFGTSVHIFDDRFALGAPFADSGGTVFLFDLDSSLPVKEIENPAPQGFKGFGLSLADANGRLLIAADSNHVVTEDGTFDYAGSVYTVSGETGELIAEIPNPSPTHFGGFGQSISNSDCGIVASSYVDRGTVYVIEDMPILAGDLNADGELNHTDINLLGQEIAKSSRRLKFDIDASGSVHLADLITWVTEMKNSWIGDANLDGEFNSTDLVQVFQQSEFEDATLGNSTWSSGDWNADLEFDSADFVLAFQYGGFEKGLRQLVNVPECIPACALFFVALLLLGERQRGSYRRTGTPARYARRARVPVLLQLVNSHLPLALAQRDVMPQG